MPVFLPFIGQARRGVHPRQPNSRAVAAQLLGRGGEPLVQGPGPLLREGPVQLPALLLGVPAGRAEAEILRNQGFPPGSAR